MMWWMELVMYSGFMLILHKVCNCLFYVLAVGMMFGSEENLVVSLC